MEIGPEYRCFSREEHTRLQDSKRAYLFFYTDYDERAVNLDFSPRTTDEAEQTHG